MFKIAQNTQDPKRFDINIPCKAIPAHGIKGYNKFVGWILSLFKVAVKLQAENQETFYLNRKSTIHWINKIDSVPKLRESAPKAEVIAALNSIAQAKKTQSTPISSNRMIDYRKQLEDKISEVVSHYQLLDAEKNALKAAYLDFFHHFAEYLVKFSEGKRIVVTGFDPEKFDIDKTAGAEAPDYFSKINTISPECKAHWEEWSQKPEMLIRLYKKFVNYADNCTYPPIDPFISEAEVKQQRVHIHYHDDGVWFFDIIIDKPQPQAPDKKKADLL